MAKILIIGGGAAGMAAAAFLGEKNHQIGRASCRERV